MTAGDAFLFLITFTLFVILALLAVLWVGFRGRDHNNNTGDRDITDE